MVGYISDEVLAKKAHNSVCHLAWLQEWGTEDDRETAMLSGMVDGYGSASKSQAKFLGDRYSLTIQICSFHTFTSTLGLILTISTWARESRGQTLALQAATLVQTPAPVMVPLASPGIASESCQVLVQETST